VTDYQLIDRATHTDHDARCQPVPQEYGLAVRLAVVLISACVDWRSVPCRAPSGVGCLGCVGVWKLPVAMTFH
jgi:hypothetical protein